MWHSRRALGASLLICAICGAANSALGDPWRVVITAFRHATLERQSGSSISVVDRKTIELGSPGTVTSTLRSLPGVNIVESGGTGATAEVRLRGAETGHTLVLIDGVRVNDSATTRDEFDFSLVGPEQIERIEVLRGPQTALYGSDAMGGVVNIITRRAGEGKRVSASIEGGSYGTFAQGLSASMRSGDYSLLLSGSHFRADGFSRVGDRDVDERDGSEKWNGTIHAAYAPADGPEFDFELTGVDQRADYDGGPPTPPAASCTPGMMCYTTYLNRLNTAANALNTVHKQLLTGYAKVSDDAFGGAYDQSLTGFFTVSKRHNTQPPSTAFDFGSTVAGAEYQGIANLGGMGTLLAGARIEREVAAYEASGFGFTSFASDRSFYALFAQHEMTFTERLHLSFGGRYDGEIGGGEDFLTGRATASYDLRETGSVFRASIGTGAKRPTAYQVASNFYAEATYPTVPVPPQISPEHNVGIDFGVDQSLFGGRAKVSATAFYTRYRDLIDFVTISSPPAPSNVVDGYYENIKNAAVGGLELSGEAELIPGVLRASGSYTYLDARNLDTGLILERRPVHSGTAALTYTGIRDFEATLSATYAGFRYNKAGEAWPLPAYTRVDLTMSYDINPNLRAFGRVENLTNATYEDPGGYNNAGLSVYAGLRWKDRR